ncbi:MAG: ferrous iron transport protein A [Clostridia bacterium]|nr:ferrous iron transport protein A [Clostridia bacterium]
MQSVFSLASLSCEESAVICDLKGDAALCERLQDLGFIENARIKCLFSASFGDPRAYRIKDTVIALRKKDADTILCKEAEEP